MSNLSKILRTLLAAIGILVFSSGCSGSIIWPDKISTENIETVSETPEGIWAIKQPAPASRMELTKDNILLFTSHRGHVYLVNPFSGEQIGKKWQPLFFSITAHVLNLSEDVLFIASQKKNQVIAHNIVQGKTLWKKKITDIQGEMVSYQDKVYLSRRDGTIIALDKQNGNIAMSVQLTKPIGKGLYQWHDQLLVTTLGGDLTILSPDLKKIKTHALELCSDPVITLTDGFVIIVNCDGQIVLLDQNGSISYPANKTLDTVYSPPQIIDQKLIIAFASGKVMAMDLTSGESIWEFNDGDGLVNLPIQIKATQVIIPYTRGTIISLDLTTGLAQWRYKLKHPIRHIKLTSAGLIVMDSKKSLSLIR